MEKRILEGTAVIKEKEISSNNRVPLQIIVESPAPTAKYVYLTFIDEK